MRRRFYAIVLSVMFTVVLISCKSNEPSSTLNNNTSIPSDNSDSKSSSTSDSAATTIPNDSNDTSKTNNSSNEGYNTKSLQ